MNAYTKSVSYIRYLILVALIFSAILIIQEIMSAPLDRHKVPHKGGIGYYISEGCWNGVRLSWSYSILLGDDLYPYKTGPILSQMYGPVTPFVYLPALLLPSINLCLMGASAISVFLYLLPVLMTLLLKTNNHPRRFLLTLGFFVLFCLFTTNMESLTYSAFTIHADAPTLGFAGMACLFLYAKKQKHAKGLTYELSALFTALSIGSKQTSIPLVVALFVYICLSEGRKEACQYLLYFFVFMALLGGLTLWVSDARAFFFNTFLIPAHTPWIKDNRLLALLGVTKDVLAQSWFFFSFLTLCLVYLLIVCRKAGVQLNRKTLINENPWCIFLLVSVFMFPVSVLLRVKVGGAENAYSPMLYFLVTAFCLFLYKYALGGNNGNGLLRNFQKFCLGTFVILMVGLVFLQATSIRNSFDLATALRHDIHSQAYLLAKKYPGKVYFPFNPLSSQMAEAKTYHCLVGIFDWNKAGFRVSNNHYQECLPQDMAFIAFPVDYRWVAYRMKYAEENQMMFKDFPGFVFFPY